MLNSSGVEKIYTLTNGLTNIQKSDLYSEVALAKKDRLLQGSNKKSKVITRTNSCKVLFCRFRLLWDTISKMVALTGKKVFNFVSMNKTSLCEYSRYI